MGGSVSMMSINIVDKKTAKQIIDNAPVDKITIICLDRKALIHEKPERREKKYGKELVEIAKSISYDENDIFGILSLDGELKSNRDILRSILFPKWNKTNKCS